MNNCPKCEGPVALRGCEWNNQMVSETHWCSHPCHKAAQAVVEAAEVLHRHKPGDWLEAETELWGALAALAAALEQSA